jgi:hypothetical protein
MARTSPRSRLRPSSQLNSLLRQIIGNKKPRLAPGHLKDNKEECMLGYAKSETFENWMGWAPAGAHKPIRT